MAAETLPGLRDIATRAMTALEQARSASEVCERLANELSPMLSAKATALSLQLLRARVADELYFALRAAQKASQAYCVAARGNFIGGQVACSRSNAASVTLRVNAVIWANWRLAEEEPTFYLLEEAARYLVPSPDTPCLGAAVWTVEKLAS